MKIDSFDPLSHEIRFGSCFVFQVKICSGIEIPKRYNLVNKLLIFFIHDFAQCIAYGHLLKLHIAIRRN